MTRYLQLGNIDCYKRAYNLSNYVWEIVINWDWFPKQTLGSQFIRSIDSISANIAEGFGRYHKKDKIRFYRVSYGSISESLDWNQKAFTRSLVTKDQYTHIITELKLLQKETNQLTRYTNLKLKQ